MKELNEVQLKQLKNIMDQEAKILDITKRYVQLESELMNILKQQNNDIIILNNSLLP